MGITLKNNKSVTKNMTIKGDNGVGIKAITSGTPVVTEEKTTTPITVTLTDETTQNFNVEAKNGSGGTGTKKYMHYILFSFLLSEVDINLNIKLNIQFISTTADKFTKETLFNFLQNEYVGLKQDDNKCFIYSPAEIPVYINISKVYFIRDDDVSLSRISIMWNKNDTTQSYGVTNSIKLDRIFGKDVNGNLGQVNPDTISNVKIYKLPITIGEVSKIISPYIGKEIDNKFIYEALIGKKLYTYDQIACDNLPCVKSLTEDCSEIYSEFTNYLLYGQSKVQLEQCLYNIESELSQIKEEIYG